MLEKEERKFLFRLTNVGVIGQLLIAPVRLWDVVLLAKLLCIAQIARSDGHDLMEQQQQNKTQVLQQQSATHQALREATTQTGRNLVVPPRLMFGLSVPPHRLCKYQFHRQTIRETIYDSDIMVLTYIETFGFF